MPPNTARLTLERYKQVLLTYRRPGIAVYLAIGAFMMLSASESTHGRISFALVMGPYLLTILLTWQLSAQFGESRASLLPRFARPHLIVSILLAAGCCAFAALGAISNHASALGTLSAASFLLASGLWIGSYQPALVSVAMIPGMLLVDYAEPTGLLSLVQGRAPIVAFLLSAASLAALWDFTRRWAKLCEEDSIYQQTVQLSRVWAGRRSRGTRVPFSDAHGGLTWRIFERLLRLNAQPVFRSGGWGRLQQARWPSRGWSLMGLAPALGFLLGLPLGLPLAACLRPLPAFFVLFCTFLAPAMALVSYISRIPMMGYELLRPVPRQTFLRRFILAMAADVLAFWMALQIGFVTSVALLARDLLHTPQFWSFLSLGIAAQFLYLGAMLWLIPITGVSQLTLTIGFVFPPSFLSPLLVTARPGTRPLLAATAIATLTALVLIASAARYWRRVELDFARR